MTSDRLGAASCPLTSPSRGSSAPPAPLCSLPPPCLPPSTQFIFTILFPHQKPFPRLQTQAFCFLKKSAVRWFSLLDLPGIPSSHLLQPSITSLPAVAAVPRGFLPCPSLARLTSSQAHLHRPHCPQTLLALLSDRLFLTHFTS